ncbi:MAG: GNAT family N-acetyltransferase [bacterium]|nr:GNAT family N-acetyltransferase [bacterium]
MNEWEGPRRARPDEFGEAMRFTDMVFRPGQKGRGIVQRQYPHVYRDEPAFARRLLLLRDKGELIGCVAVHPIVLRLGAAQVSAGGIGIVGTHPERRGEGIMTCLLTEAIRQMRAAGHAVSVLGGDRQRYARFGWENAGVCNVYELTSRSLGTSTVTDHAVRLKKPDAAMFRRIRRLSGARTFGVERKLADTAPLLLRNGKEAWVCQEGRRFAYAVAGGAGRTNRPYTTIHEFGGDAQLVLTLFRRLLRHCAAGRLSVVAGPNPDEQALLTPVSSTWSRRPAGMTQVLDPCRVVQQLRPELLQRAHACKISACFEFHVTCVNGKMQQATIDLRAPGQHNRSRPYYLRIDQLELVELLFGCLPLHERFEGHRGIPAGALSALAAILPVPLHIPSLSHI